MVCQVQRPGRPGHSRSRRCPLTRDNLPRADAFDQVNLPFGLARAMVQRKHAVHGRGWGARSFKRVARRSASLRWDPARRAECGPGAPPRASTSSPLSSPTAHNPLRRAKIDALRRRSRRSRLLHQPLRCSPSRPVRPVAARATQQGEHLAQLPGVSRGDQQTAWSVIDDYSNRTRTPYLWHPNPGDLAYTGLMIAPTAYVNERSPSLTVDSIYVILMWRYWNWIARWRCEPEQPAPAASQRWFPSSREHWVQPYIRLRPPHRPGK